LHSFSQLAQLGWVKDIQVFVSVQMENQVVVSDYSQMDRILREERQYLLNICKKIKKAGCNVLLIQKSILRLAEGTAREGSSPLMCGCES
jgi:T-complex protein 1 subunit delta